jgi:hypothetical protein
MIDNVGSVENKGLEVEIGGTPVAGTFIWSTGFNITLNRSEVISIGDDEFLPIGEGHGGSGFEDPLMRLIAGEPFGVMFGYEYLGTWSSSEVEEAAVYGHLPGDPRFEDINNDGIVDVNDLQIIGYSLPKFFYGWQNTLTYKGFNLDILFQGVYGGELFNEMRIRLENPGEANTPAILDRWSPDNQDTDVPAYIDDQTRLDAALPNNDFADQRSSRWIEDASYFRCKYISLGYNFTDQTLSRIGIRSLRAYISGTNLFTITNYSGYDPEVSSFNESDAHVGVDYGNYPSAHIFSLGIDISF